MNQMDVILEYLQQGHSITPLEALEKFGCMRLGARIWDLHKQGYQILCDMVNDHGKHYAKYYMPRRDVQKEFKYQGAETCLSQ